MNQYELGVEPPWGPIGQEVYKRTYMRPGETWTDTVNRVVDANCDLAPDHIEPDERQKLKAHIANFRLLPAGRHLWAAGAKTTLGLYNCHRAGWDNSLSGHFTFTFDQLMLGGGVGANYSSEYLADTPLIRNTVKFKPLLSMDHPDYAECAPRVSPDLRGYMGFTVSDTREGWVAALQVVIDAHAQGIDSVTIDFSGVRSRGTAIKGFGGVASGPGPLIEMLHKVNTILNSKVGLRLDPITAMTIDHLVASCVIAGNVRRSARMSILHWRDPHIMEFINCKSDSDQHWTTNISVEVDDEFWEQGDQHSVDVLDAIVAGMHRNGEPGIYNSEAAAVGEPNDVRATNPCVTGDTMVTTTDGLRTVESLMDHRTAPDLVVDGKPHKHSGFFCTGVKPTFVLNIDGTDLRLTADHQVSTPDGYVAAGDLKLGDQVHLTDNEGVSWDGPGTNEEGYLIGMLVGDGTFYNLTAILRVWDTDTGSEGVMGRVSSCIEAIGLKHRSDWLGWRREATGHILRSAALMRLADRWGVTRGNKTVTPEIMGASSDFMRGFLQGLFDADGHVEGVSTSGGVSVRLSQSDSDMLANVQIMLLALGIKSAVRDMKPAGVGIQGYACKASYRLIISGQHTARYAKTIGFNHTEKDRKLAERIGGMSRGFYHKPHTGTVQAFYPTGEQETVYDVQVPGVNKFVANGVVVHNCGEIALNDWEQCCLGHLNMAALAHSDPMAVHEAARLMTRFLIRATLANSSDVRQEIVKNRNRRIGVGLTGVHDWCALSGFRWDRLPFNFDAQDYLTALKQTVDRTADNYAAELGIFRPVKTTTIAPTGTVSKLAGVSEGLQPPFSRYFVRRVRYSDNDPQLAELKKTHPTEPCRYSPNTTVVSFHQRDPLVGQVADRYICAADEAPVEDYFRVQRTLQRVWADNAISITANFDRSDVDQERLKKAILWSGPYVKGLTAMPESGRPQAPYERITEAEYLASADQGVGQAIDDCRSGACPVR